MSFECNLYKLFFDLWGGGGPNWRAEFAAFTKEEESSWTYVAAPGSSTPAGVGSTPVHDHSFADVVKSPPLSGANSVPIKPVSGANRVMLGSNSSFIPRKSVFERIVFPPNLVNSRSFEASNHPIHGRSNAQNQLVSSSAHAQHFNSSRCSRCLSISHPRNRCNNAIKCLVCFGWGHLAVACLKNLNTVEFPSKGKEPMDIDQAGNSKLDSSTWFRLANGLLNGPSSSTPPVFAFFVEWAAHLSGGAPQQALNPHRPIIVTWSDPLNSEVGPDQCELTLGGGSLASTRGIIPPVHPSLDHFAAQESPVTKAPILL